MLRIFQLSGIVVLPLISPKKINAKVLVRGLRVFSDFEHEFRDGISKSSFSAGD